MNNRFLRLAIALSCAILLVGCNLLIAPAEKSSGTKSYTVSFNANAGSDMVTNLPDAITNVSSGAMINKPSSKPIRAGYFFSGWYKEASCQNVWNFEIDTVNEDTILYVKWSTIPVYSVNFDPNAGSDTVSNMPQMIENVEAGSKIFIPSNVPTRSGYQFVGWYKDSSCTNEWIFSSDAVLKNTVLYVKWVGMDIDLCTLSFDTGESGWVIDTIVREAGSVFDLEAYLTKHNNDYRMTNPDFEAAGTYADSAYTEEMLDKWGDSEDGVNYSEYTITESQTLYIKMLSLHEIKFFANGGVFPDSSTLKTDKTTEGESLNEVISYMPVPLKDGSVFSRWTTDEAGTEIIDQNAVVLGELSLYAQWIVLDTSLSGYWTYGENGSRRTLYLDTNTGTGLFFAMGYGSSINEITFTDSTLAFQGNTWAYTYNNNSLVLDGTLYSRLSETKASGGDLPEGVYYIYSWLLTVNNDGTVTGKRSSSSSNLFAGKWSSDTDYIYLLSDDNKVIARYTRSTWIKTTTTDLGGYYYNYAGTIDEEGKIYPDKYSMYLGTDGTYSIWFWGHELAGSWFSAGSSIFFSDVNSEESFDTEYQLKDGKLEFSDGDDVLSRLSTKGTVSTYNPDSALTGSWSGKYNGFDVDFTFTEQGLVTQSMASPEYSYTSTSFFSYIDGMVYLRGSSITDIFYETSGVSAVLNSDGTLTWYDSFTLTKQ